MRKPLSILLTAPALAVFAIVPTMGMATSGSDITCRATTAEYTKGAGSMGAGDWRNVSRYSTHHTYAKRSVARRCSVAPIVTPIVTPIVIPIVIPIVTPIVIHIVTPIVTPTPTSGVAPGASAPAFTVFLIKPGGLTAMRSRLRVPGSGKVIQSARSTGSNSIRVCTATKTAFALTTMIMRCNFTRAALTALGQRSLRVRVTTTFTPTQGTAQVRTNSITLKARARPHRVAVTG